MTYRVRNHKLAFGSSNVEFVRSPNVSGNHLELRFLVVHYTASGPGSNIAKYFSNSSAKVSAHIVIQRDGTVIQCVPFDMIGWHAGKSRWVSSSGQTYNGLNKYSIGIEIENWGPLKWTGGEWRSWTGAKVENSRVIEARHKFGTPNCGWETYTEAQIRATVEVARAICEEYGITEILGHDDISPGRKSDPGPAWEMNSFKTLVFGRSEGSDVDDPGNALFVVRSSTGLNIRSGPGATYDKLRGDALPDGTLIEVIEADGNWRYVAVLDANGDAEMSGWVHNRWLIEA